MELTSLRLLPSHSYQQPLLLTHANLVLLSVPGATSGVTDSPSLCLPSDSTSSTRVSA